MLNKYFFSKEIITQIVEYTGESSTMKALKSYMEPHDNTSYNILITGGVQSGKTAEIMKIIEDPTHSHLSKIVVIQNSLLVLNQYKSRFREHNIAFQVIQKNTQIITEKVILLLNNCHRKKYYQNARHRPKPNQYILILDESDMYDIPRQLFPNMAVKIYHVTATPYHSKYEHYFDEIHTIDTSHTSYYGLENIHIYCSEQAESDAVKDFVSCTSSPQMLLINNKFRIQQMKLQAMRWSEKYPDIPIILLTTEKRVYLRGESMVLKHKFISRIIDDYMAYSHIIFISNRMSLRGLSYTSSDYTRHLTHQCCEYRPSMKIENFIQRLRLLGVYKDSPVLKLYNVHRCEASRDIYDVAGAITNAPSYISQRCMKKGLK